MLQDQLFNSIKYLFQLKKKETQFNEYSTVLKKRGISNWDQGLANIEARVLIDLGIAKQDVPIFMSEIYQSYQDVMEMHSVTSSGELSNRSSSSPHKMFSGEQIDQSIRTLFEIFDQVNQNFFHQFQDLCQIMLLCLLSGQKMLIVGPSSSNVQDIFREFMKHVDIDRHQVYNHTITSETSVEELCSVGTTQFETFGNENYSQMPIMIPVSNIKNTIPNGKSNNNNRSGNGTVAQNQFGLVSQEFEECKFYFLHHIFESSSTVLNFFLKFLADDQNHKKTCFFTSEQDPNYRVFDIIMDEFCINFWDCLVISNEPQKKKQDKFDQFLDAVWSNPNSDSTPHPSIKQPNLSNRNNQTNAKSDKNDKESVYSSASQYVEHQNRSPKSQVNSNSIIKVNQSSIRIERNLLDAIADEANARVGDSTGFLRVYLKDLREMLINEQIFISQKRWLRIFRMLKIIAFTRRSDQKANVTLTDCFLVPFFIAKNKEQFIIVQQINVGLIENLSQIYGSLPLNNAIDSCFWLLDIHREQMREMQQRSSQFPSFYNCIESHPDYFKIQTEILPHQSEIPVIFYSCTGGDRKILSDEHIAIDPSKVYQFKIDLQTSSEMILYIGIICFDSNKQFIHSTQVCRITESAVTLEGQDEEKLQLILAQDQQDVSQLWNQYDSGSKEQARKFAYLRSIGVYQDGDLNQLLTLSNVISDTQNPYSEQPEHGGYTFAKNNVIQLTKDGWEKYRSIKEKGGITFGKTQLMNHFEGGTYTFAQCFDEYIKQWSTKNYWFKGETRANENNQFRKGTQYIKIVLLSNYNSGYPDFQVANKNAILFWRNIEFKQVQ